MARKKISQREARRLQKKVGELMLERNHLMSRFRSEVITGVYITTTTLTTAQDDLLDLARKMGYAIVVKQDGSHQRFYAVK